MLFCHLDQFFPQRMILFVKSSFVVVVQSLSHVWLFATPRTAACQPFLSFTISQGLFKLMSIESVMPSHHLVLCHPLLLLPSVFPSIRSSPMRQLFAWGGQSIGASALASVPLVNIQGLFPWELTDLLAVQGTLKSLLQHHILKASILWCSAFFMVLFSHPFYSFDYTDLCGQSDVSVFLICCLGLS